MLPIASLELECERGEREPFEISLNALYDILTAWNNHNFYQVSMMINSTCAWTDAHLLITQP